MATLRWSGACWSEDNDRPGATASQGVRARAAGDGAGAYVADE